MNNFINIQTYNYQSTRRSKISRPVNCFMAFRSEKYQEIASQTPGINNRDISKIIAKWWREMTEEQKAPYRAIALKAKADHELKYPNYTYHPIKKSQRKVRPYHRREDAVTRQRKAQKSELKLKQWLGGMPDTLPYLSPSTSPTLQQNSPASSFTSVATATDNNGHAYTDFSLISPFIDFTHVDHDFPFLSPDLFSSCHPIYNDNYLSQSPVTFDLESSLFTDTASLDLAAWTSSTMDDPSSPFVSPDLISLENFLFI